MNTLVSVIMPAFNAEKYIAQSIESVIRQTYANWELIVINDGSTDNTAAIIDKYMCVDSRIKYFYQENGRQGKAKNLGIKNCKGDYIAFLDADDLWVEEKLELTLHEIVNSDYSLIFTDCYVFEGVRPVTVSDLKTMGVSEAVYEGRTGLITFLHYNRIPNLTVLVKKDTFTRTGGFTDKIVAEEYEMWLSLLQQGAVFKAIAKPLSLYRIHDESITAKDRHATFEVIEIVKSFGKKHQDYAGESNKIARERIKYWLYHGEGRSTKKFRILLRGLFPLPLTALFNCLSFILPIDQLRKIIIRLY